MIKINNLWKDSKQVSFPYRKQEKPNENQVGCQPLRSEMIKPIEPTIGKPPKPDEGILDIKA